MNSSVDLWGIAGGVAAFAFSAILCTGLIVLLRPLLERYAMAKLTSRSSHRTPTPQGGGIAVIGAALGIALIVMLSLPELGATAAIRLAPVFAATLFIAIVGAVDDIRTIAVAPRLALQALAIAVVLATLPADLRVVPLLPWWIERALLLVAGLWFVNLTNFMDGIDWMSVAEVVPVTVGLMLLGLLGALPPAGIIVALALCGAMIGFAPFNRPVARLFLGDVGSLPIGLLLGWLLLQLAGNGHLAAAVILPLYYLGDTTITLGRRMANREPFWEAHRSHFYQRATDRGFNASEIVARVFAANIGLVGLATATVLIPKAWMQGLAILIAAGLVGGLLRTLARGKR